MMHRAASELKKTLAELNFDESVARKLSGTDRLRYLGKILRPRLLGVGRHRYVFTVNGHYVVKVPVYASYSRINCQEWRLFRKRQQAGSKWSRPIEPAKCCLVEIAGSKLLVMERLAQVHTPEHNTQPPKSWPHWVNELDCAQCGVSADGKVVAFDYGTDGRLFR